MVLNEAGQELGHWRGPNSPAGWESLLQWADGFGTPRHWGVEGAWSYGRGLAQLLASAGETVYEINPRWTAARRLVARRPGKTDRLDARAVGLLVRQEAPGLPRVLPDDDTAILDLLSSEREAALVEATRLRNQIHALLLQLDPEYRSHLPTIDSKAGLDALIIYTSPQSDLLSQQRSASVRRLAERLRLALTQAEDLKKEIQALAKPGFSPLAKLCGVNLLTAGALAGILGPGNRFSTESQLAAYAGAAPLETSSAGVVRHRLNRGGNRRLNAILHMIALTQMRCWPPAQAYIERKTSEGKSKREAMRALKRFLARAIWRQWQECIAIPLSSQVIEAA
jgi:transposase